VLQFARPALLAAGILAALVPLLLHLIARRPPERMALPTARFLQPDARTAIRLRRRPTDLLLLALRMLLLALLGAAAAGPAWLPRQRGMAELVLLDRSGAMDGQAWTVAVGEARRALLGPDGTARGALVLFDSAAAPVVPGEVTAALFDSLAAAGPGRAAPDYAAALRAVPASARGLGGADSVRVTMLSALRWDGWRPGLSAVRRAAWPGAIRVPELPSAQAPASTDTARSSDAPRRAAAVVAAPGFGGYVAAALGATGWTVASAADSASAYFLLGPVDGTAASRVRPVAGSGATVVVSGAVPAGWSDALPWVTSDTDGSDGDADAATGGALVMDDGTRLDGAARRLAGRPKAGARLLAAWDDGRPAIAASRVGRGCVVYVGTELEVGSLPLGAAFPRVVDRLARGCADVDQGAGGAVPLDAGARATLRGGGGEAVAVASLGAAGGGIPLARWVVAAALLVALVETWLAYGRRRSA
jgi:hypothetical protein